MTQHYIPEEKVNLHLSSQICFIRQGGVGGVSRSPAEHWESFHLKKIHQPYGPPLASKAPSEVKLPQLNCLAEALKLG